MSKYTGIDAAILSAIKSGANDFTVISLRVSAAAKPHVTASKPEFRVIDGRLQALRKAGQIAYSRTAGWRLCAAKEGGAA